MRRIDPGTGGGPCGIGPDGSAPWLPQPASWENRSVEAESRDAGSTLALYRVVLRIRREHPGLAGDAFAWVDAPTGTLWFACGDGSQCVVNLSPHPVQLPSGRTTLVSSVPGIGDLLPTDAAEWFVASLT